MKRNVSFMPKQSVELGKSVNLQPVEGIPMDAFP